jgi:hypothetical protein
MHEETFEFEPARVASVFGDKQVENFGICAGLDRRGTRLYLWDEFVRQNELITGERRPIAMAGYDVGVQRGESCHLRVLDTFQAAVAFDLSALPTSAVKDARLIIHHNFSPLDPVKYRGHRDQCGLFRIYQATEDWAAGIFWPDGPSGPRDLIAGTPIRPAPDPLGSEVDVTRAVGGWARGERQNFGFTIMPDLSRVATLFEGADQEPGWMCEMGVVDFQLVVTVMVPDS